MTNQNHADIELRDPEYADLLGALDEMEATIVAEARMRQETR